MQPSAREFGDHIHIDLLSMPRLSAGHVAICTAVDAATGFVFALPDLGVENKNSEVEQLLASYKIRHITSSRAHPQSNGLVERLPAENFHPFSLLSSDTRVSLIMPSLISHSIITNNRRSANN